MYLPLTLGNEEHQTLSQCRKPEFQESYYSELKTIRSNPQTTILYFCFSSLVCLIKYCYCTEKIYLHLWQFQCPLSDWQELHEEIHVLKPEKRFPLVNACSQYNKKYGEQLKASATALIFIFFSCFALLLLCCCYCCCFGQRHNCCYLKKNF